MGEHRKGYVIAAFNFTDMPEVERDDTMEYAIRQYIVFINASYGGPDYMKDRKWRMNGMLPKKVLMITKNAL